MRGKGERVTSRKRPHTGTVPHVVDKIFSRRREARYGGESDCLAGRCRGRVKYENVRPLYALS